ncbi:MAG: alanine racemase [Alphaproteobacteria bacterium]|uniref:Alanine racemase n=1 Tax=Candidatus Nitrobium versatile TaxID=2884831 RepID=A0A953M1Y7_9BACT|nr:alanine racemase [Candidatus Nitrobium versatile]
MNRGTIAEIDLRALSANLRVVRGLARDCSVIAVVKADAYGHGAVEVSRRLVKDGADCLAVAFTDEARALRQAGIAVPLLVLFDSRPESDDVLAHNLIPVVSSREVAFILSKEAERANRQISVHIKVDTGMGRLGLEGAAARSIEDISRLGGIHIAGVMSHFSEADLADVSFSQKQINKFRALQSELSAAGVEVPLFHMANSAAIMALPESHLDAVRPGLMLYGYSPLAPECERDKGVFRAVASLQPVMTVRTRIVAIRKVPAGMPVSYCRTFVTQRESRIAVIAAGYADGFNRKFSNNAEVLVRGKRVPVVGRVCMDLTMVDVTEIQEAEEDDEVVIVGKQGEMSVDAAELAMRADTIPYEVLIALGSKARRVYK